jgi:two-component system phosphate regulon sensor histidine kinase PhoR
VKPTSDSAELWRLTWDNSPIGMALVALDGRLLVVNRALCDMVGYDAESLLERGIPELTHPADLAANLALYGQTLAGERDSYRMLKRYLHADGRIVWGDLSVALVRASDGGPLHFISQILDVTKQREHEERLEAASAALAQEQQTLAAFFDAVSVGLLLIGNDGQYERMNRRHRETMSLPFPDGHRGRAGQLGDVYFLDGRTRMSKEDMPSYRAVQGEEFDDYTYWVGDDPRTRAAFSVSARHVRSPAGEKIGSALAYQEITDLMRARQAQDEFLSSMSHELRTPLTAILGYLEMLVEDEELPPDVIAQLRIVERNASRLGALLSDLLQVGQAREGRFPLQRAAVDLVALAREAVEASRPTAERNGVALELRVPEICVAVVDKQRIRQVLDNLLSNGIKYTPPGGQVRVTLTQTATGVELTISDTGIGIGEDEVDLVFDRFHRGQEARENHLPGTGLGLNIVRSIVTAHGGAVTLDSAAGQGSTFRVTLPQPTS